MLEKIKIPAAELKVGDVLVEDPRPYKWPVLAVERVGPDVSVTIEYASGNRGTVLWLLTDPLVVERELAT